MVTRDNNTDNNFKTQLYNLIDQKLDKQHLNDNSFKNVTRIEYITPNICRIFGGHPDVWRFGKSGYLH